MSALQRKVQGVKSLPPRPPMLHSKFKVQKRDFSVIPWSNYFDCDKEAHRPESSDVFHYYQKGSLNGPIVVLLHGGGFSGLSWALFCKSITDIVDCCCIAVDQRGHGSTKTKDDLNLTADQLVDDIAQVVDIVLEETQDSSNPVILIGHSMGGAVAVHAAVKQSIPNLVGLIVIDVVEGSALESLHAMRGVLSNRPKQFESVEKANEWCIKTGYIRNSESARVSMIGQLVKQDLPMNITASSQTHQLSNIHKIGTIEEEDSSKATNSATCPLSETSKHEGFVWRIDLSKTSQYWEGWFKGMSSMFLSVSAPKLLLLAGVDRLDAQMTTAQMQGKFQMQIVARSGHAVHEDAPDKVAQAVAGFLIRHKWVTALEGFQKPMPAC